MRQLLFARCIQYSTSKVDKYNKTKRNKTRYFINNDDKVQTYDGKVKDFTVRKMLY